MAVTKFGGMVEERYKLLAWLLIDYAREHSYSIDEFRHAIAFLFGWSICGESEEFKKALSAIVMEGMNIISKRQEK